jgi:hypothetical protein
MGNTTGRPRSKGPTAFAEELARRGGQESEWASQAGRTPLTDALHGAVKLPADFDERAVLKEELQMKYGSWG